MAVTSSCLCLNETTEPSVYVELRGEFRTYVAIDSVEVTVTPEVPTYQFSDEYGYGLCLPLSLNHERSTWTIYYAGDSVVAQVTYAIRFDEEGNSCHAVLAQVQDLEVQVDRGQVTSVEVTETGYNPCNFHQQIKVVIQVP